mmetsp:Transcript_35841/g.47309  ORF Transcript_35841/g.47309 Transcript_35841/m.47309 type:complete len:307 (-) Transcript_35841:160-1080(-)|eukprot:CAMPEP_0117765290 /NCGR_PEP_ID=MMETSP0947-20121206/20014_1 /TAXON_ID=44440 /ORGANISM="Chattonella subsalsa, Strain CCMP2191" /LENGTH=306 /DNA_ID=CAMNT_0005587897 /DNA_START=73 /DNA_END=993 /DNA_ORIENTATION=+
MRNGINTHSNLEGSTTLIKNDLNKIEEDTPRKAIKAFVKSSASDKEVKDITIKKSDDNEEFKNITPRKTIKGFVNNIPVSEDLPESLWKADEKELDAVRRQNNAKLSTDSLAQADNCATPEPLAPQSPTSSLDFSQTSTYSSINGPVILRMRGVEIPIEVEMRCPPRSPQLSQRRSLSARSSYLSLSSRKSSYFEQDGPNSVTRRKSISPECKQVSESITIFETEVADFKDDLRAQTDLIQKAIDNFASSNRKGCFRQLLDFITILLFSFFSITSVLTFALVFLDRNYFCIDFERHFHDFLEAIQS